MLRTQQDQVPFSLSARAQAPNGDDQVRHPKATSGLYSEPRKQTVDITSLAHGPNSRDALFTPFGVSVLQRALHSAENVYVHTYLCITYICLIYIYTCIYIYVYTHICIYIHIYVAIFQIRRSSTGMRNAQPGSEADSPGIVAPLPSPSC